MWTATATRPPTPHDYFSGGAILPVGVDQGHKGYALSFMVEVFSGLLTGLGFGIDPEGRHNDGCFIAAFNLEHFRPLDEFKKDMGEFVEFIKDSPPAAGFTEVLYPGEIEYRTEQRRRREGIFVEDDTWEQISGLMKIPRSRKPRRRPLEKLRKCLLSQDQDRSRVQRRFAGKLTEVGSLIE